MTIVRQRVLVCGDCGRRVEITAEDNGSGPVLKPTQMPAACHFRETCKDEFELGMLDADYWAEARRVNGEKAT